MNGGKPRIEFHFRSNGARSCQLRVEELQHGFHQLIDVYRLELWRGHFGEIAKTADDGLQIAQFGKQRLRALTKDLFKLIGMLAFGPFQIFDGDL